MSEPKYQVGESVVLRTETNLGPIALLPGVSGTVLSVCDAYAFELAADLMIRGAITVPDENSVRYYINFKCGEFMMVHAYIDECDLAPVE
jgi:hypothetical protein